MSDLENRPKSILRFLFARARRLCVGALLMIVLLCLIKLPWIMAFRVDAAALLRNKTGQDILTRRAYLIDRYQNGSFDPSSMPKMIGAFFQGEWAIGTCSMTAAALTNIAYLYPETRAESVNVLDGLSKLVLTESFRRFDFEAWGEDPLQSLDGSNGHIGYLGHVNLILAARRLLGGTNEYDELLININEAFVRRLNQNSFPYLETYPAEIYTADNMVVYAGLRLYDQIFGRDNSALYARWTEYTRSKLLDPRTNLLVFRVDRSGNRLWVSRGSGVGWNSYYLPFFNKEFAGEQFHNAKRHLVAEFPLGIKGFREYARGVPGFGDIDSGPVVFGISTSGTGFIVAGARHAKDVDLLNGLLLTAEIFGSTVQWKGKRRYLIAPLVGDAIMLAMKTAVAWDTRYLK